MKTFKRLLAIPILTMIFLSIKAQQPSDWILHRKSNNIEIYYQEIISSQKTLLKIKMVNTSPHSIDFNWTLLKDINTLYQNIRKVIPGNSEIFIDETLYPVVIGKQDVLTSYICSIILN